MEKEILVSTLCQCFNIPQVKYRKHYDQNQLVSESDIITTKELPNEDIRRDLLEQLAELKKELSAGSSEPVKQAKVGRNDPCPCESGKKYKKCCKK